MEIKKELTYENKNTYFQINLRIPENSLTDFYLEKFNRFSLWFDRKHK